MAQYKKKNIKWKKCILFLHKCKTNVTFSGDYKNQIFDSLQIPVILLNGNIALHTIMFHKRVGTQVARGRRARGDANS